LKTYGSSDTVPVPVINTNNYNCSGEINPSGWNVSYNGNGVYDSIKLSDDNTGEQPSEVDILYAQAVSDLSNGLPVQAIIDFKYLTDNYPEYEDLPKILYEFYSCYQMLDTNEGQNYRQPLYQDIIDYLNEKLLSDDFTKNSDFIDNAFDIILMAESIINLNSAAGGYEFLAFNHPDPDIRLTASWNYNEIQELINSGNGGGNQFQITNDKFQIEDQNQLKEHNELIRLNELISDDPVMSKMKRSFEKTSTERKERTDKQISREIKTGEVLNEKIVRSRQVDLQKEDRAKRNIFQSKNMNKEEKELRRMEDLALSTLDIRNEIKLNPIQNIPNEYNLEQNYPNPFNPVTHLEFAISNLGFVSLKIYDVLGKEIKTLVNEIRQPGIYKVEFDGSSLASGIYFYTIEAGSFKQTKRMLLLK
jgi:hypothetical protein